MTNTKRHELFGGPMDGAIAELDGTFECRVIFFPTSQEGVFDVYFQNAIHPRRFEHIGHERMEVELCQR